MRKYLLFSVAVLSAASFNLSAAAISPEEAIYKAAEVLTKNTTRSLASSAMSVDKYGNEIYVVNSSGGGWALIANDDRLARPILAYSLSGHYSVENLPVNALSQLEAYSREIASIPEWLEFIPVKNTRTSTEVAPLLGSTEWGQFAPYNLLCPEKDGVRTVTGCVNTAISQIMYYHNYPSQGQGENSYDWNGTTLSMDFSKSVYEWGLMLPQYIGNYSEESALAVAKLMYDCGIANNSHYGSSTGASLNIPGMVNYFGYDPSIYYVSRNLCSQKDFESILRDELDAARPVFYEGGSARGAHAFVCDGYDSDGYFHFNFGWDGHSNGYYLTTATGFDSSPGFICSIMPYCNGEPGLWVGSHKDFLWMPDLDRINCDLGAFIDCGKEADIEVGLALQNVNTDVITYFPIIEFVHTDSFYVDSMTLTAEVADGNYTVFPVYRVDGGKWHDVCFAENYSNHVDLQVENGVKTFTNSDMGGEIAEDVLSINGCYYRLEGNDAVFTKRNNRNNCYSGNITIPAEIEVDDKYYHVVSIDKGTFDECILDDVVIGEYVNVLGGFSGASIGNIIFSDHGNLKEIGPWAFNGTRIKSVSIPYGVTGIGMCAFQSCSLEKVDIPYTVTQIARVAFNYSMSLKDVYVHWTESRSLPNLGETPFQGCDIEAITLHVPLGCSDIYRSAPVWKEFVNIVEDASGVGELVTSSQLQIQVSGNGLTIKGLADGATANIINLQGISVARVMADETVILDKGVYIIQTGNRIYKIII